MTSSASPRRRRGIDQGTIKATVLIETFPAAFEMEEILYELREPLSGAERRALGLHLLGHQVLRRPSRHGPARPRRCDHDRALHAGLHRPAGATCHRRGAHAMGGMAALIPPARTPRPTSGPGRRPGGQGARGLTGLRRHLGGPSRPRPGRPGGLRSPSSATPQPVPVASVTTCT